MKAVYPGSFAPWHEGHADVVTKAKKIFSDIIVAQGVNPAKGVCASPPKLPDLVVTTFPGLLVDFVSQYNQKNPNDPIKAVIRGLRSGYDLNYEQQYQYWNEDLGLEIPIVYFVTDRKFGHISSSVIRQLESFGVERKLTP